MILYVLNGTESEYTSNQNKTKKDFIIFSIHTLEELIQSHVKLDIKLIKSGKRYPRNCMS